MRKISPTTASFTGLDQRVAPRSNIYCRLPMVMPDGRQEMGTCVNISADGILVRTESRIETGDMVIVKMPVIGRIAARAIWTVAGKIGLQFDRMIPVEDYLPLLKALGVSAQPN